MAEPGRWRPDWLAPLVVIIPTAVLAAVTATVGQGPWGDQAVIQLSTDRAARFQQLLGPYSRFGWSHPGPLYFYLLAPLYKLLGSSQRSLAVASVVLAGLFALITVLIVARLAGPTAARWAAALALVEMAALGPPVVAEIWNPVAIILPAGTFLVAAAALVSGRWWALPLVVGLGSFLVETDVSTGLLVAGIALVSLVGAVWSARRTSRPAMAAWGAGSIVLGALLWWAPLAEQLHDHPGNLTLVLRFFRSSPGGHGLGPAVRAVAGALWPPLRGRLGSLPPPAPTAELIVASTLAAALVAGGLAWRRGRPAATALAAMGALGILAGIASATRVTGPLFAYLVEWISPTVMVLLLALVLAVGPSGSRPGWHRSAGLVALAAAVALCATSLVDRPAAPGPGRQVEALWNTARPDLAGARSVEVQVATASRWPWAAGLLVELTHAGFDTTAQSRWLFLFGRQFAAPPGYRPSAVLRVWAPGSGPRPPGRLVAAQPGTEVFVSPG